MKYIDAERLQAFLQKKLEAYKSKMVDPLKYPIDHIDLMALLAREYQTLIIQIDSLKQEMWKPNEEQMKALKLAYEDAFECPEGGVPHLTLLSLLSDLQKLL